MAHETSSTAARVTRPRPLELRKQRVPATMGRTVTAEAAPDEATTKQAPAEKTPTDTSSTARWGSRTEN
ncbi:hypothetical protein ACWD11_20395 [Streptomyces sp. NPDC002776]